jgi:hypothetical protein
VVNPDDGVGRSQNGDYAQGIPALREAGVVVLGYVDTSYAQREISQVEAEMDLFQSWYHVDGVFFDQAASQPGQEDYYSTLTRHALSHGMSLTVANPGTRAPSYVGTAKLLVTYEHAGLPAFSSLSGLPGGRKNYAAIAYGVQAIDASWLAEAERYLGYIYITDKGMPNPYDALPSYFGTLVAKLSQG